MLYIIAGIYLFIFYSKYHIGKQTFSLVNDVSDAERVDVISKLQKKMWMLENKTGLKNVPINEKDYCFLDTKFTSTTKHNVVFLCKQGTTWWDNVNFHVSLFVEVLMALFFYPPSIQSYFLAFKRKMQLFCTTTLNDYETH